MGKHSTNKHLKNSKNSNKTINKKILLIFSCIALAVIVAIAVITVCIINGNSPDKDSTKDTAASLAAATSSETETKPSMTLAYSTSEPSVIEENPTEQTVPINITYTEELENYLTQNGTTKEAFEESGCKQLVVVIGNSTSAQIKMYECTENIWSENTELSCNGFVGAKGTVTEMSEYISGTPKGLYTVNEAFYIDSAPQTKLNTFEITNDVYWIDDPDSKYYNQKVIGTEDMDWNSAEHMIDYYSSYKYGFVIGYNPTNVKGAGSAIFFHIGSRATQGCVATSEDMVLAYLAKLDAAQNPYILIL